MWTRHASVLLNTQRKEFTTISDKLHQFYLLTDMASHNSRVLLSTESKYWVPLYAELLLLV